MERRESGGALIWLLMAAAAAALTIWLIFSITNGKEQTPARNGALLVWANREADRHE